MPSWAAHGMLAFTLNLQGGSPWATATRTGSTRPSTNMTAAVASYASWGFFDFRRDGEGFDEGYQSVPANWEISSARKRGFFEKVKEITGY